ncbi:MAG: hypothetical protein Q8M74_06960 [Chloroflexota bacterium]|nr:hypothetical protein [Chloroflexota bacterium]
MEPLGLDAIAIHVGDHAPAAYAAAWNRELPEPQRIRAIAEWTRSLEAESVRRVHAGVIAMGRATGDSAHDARFMTVERDDRTVTAQTIEDFVSQPSPNDLGVAPGPGQAERCQRDQGVTPAARPGSSAPGDPAVAPSRP